MQVGKLVAGKLACKLHEFCKLVLVGNKVLQPLAPEHNKKLAPEQHRLAPEQRRQAQVPERSKELVQQQLVLEHSKELALGRVHNKVQEGRELDKVLDSERQVLGSNVRELLEHTEPVGPEHSKSLVLVHNIGPS